MMEFVVVKGDDILEFASREDLVRYFVVRDYPRWVLHQMNLDEYVPRIFSDIALNPNDQKTMYSERQLSGDKMFFRYLSLDHVPRTTMVFDSAGRIVDIRLWLDDFRAEVVRQTKPLPYGSGSMGAKPRYTKMYRVPRGLRRSAMGINPADREDILELVGNVSQKLMKKDAPDRIGGFSFRHFEKSWKRNSKARKNWQRHKKAPCDQLAFRNEVYSWMEEEDLMALLEG